MLAKLNAEMCVVSAHTLPYFAGISVVYWAQKTKLYKDMSENNTYYCMILRSFAVENLQLTNMELCLG